MTQVDFYLSGEPEGTAKGLLACRLANKAYQQGHQVYILAQDESQARQLDDQLWTFAQGSFVPHRLWQDTGEVDVPVLVGDTKAPADWHDVLISLVPEVPPFFSRFERVIELVGGEEQDKAEARERFRFYRDRGYALETHEL